MKNWTIGTRTGLGFAAVLLITLALGSASFWSMKHIERNVTILESDTVPCIMDVLLINATLKENLGLVQAHINTKTEKERYASEIAANVEKMNALIKDYQGTPLSAEDRVIFDEFIRARTKFVQTFSQVLSLSKEGRTSEANQMAADTLMPAFQTVNAALVKLIDYNSGDIGHNLADVRSALNLGKKSAMIGLSAALLVGMLLSWLIVRSIVLPIKECVTLTGKLAEGDFSRDVPPALCARGDELGDQARAFSRMTENLRNLILEISTAVDTLAASSVDLTDISKKTAVDVTSVANKTNTVAAATEEASANTSSVATGMEQAANNLSSVAGATEEMSATVGEIASNSEKARVISEQAMASAESISTMVQQLGHAAQDIGKVTETITVISSQTNLLALNATIEAARAGAAGKGFAVVANEIKELARQTAEATEDIKAKIAGVQTSAGSAITDIDKIVGVIREVGAIVSTIAAAIEEQAVVTKDVAGNIAQASTEVKDSNERISQTAVVARSIAEDVSGISSAVGGIRQGGEQVEASAAQLAQLTEELRGMMARFKTKNAGTRPSGVKQHPHRGLSVPASVAHAPAPSTSGAGRPFIEWTDEFSVGVPAMDAHHRKLFDLINNLHAAMRSGRSREVLGMALEDLAKYVNYHFAAEEKLMREHRCSGLADQIAAHSGLVEKVKMLREQFAAGKEGLGVDVLNMLRDWLVNHIKRKDKGCMSTVCEVAKARDHAHA